MAGPRSAEHSIVNELSEDDYVGLAEIADIARRVFAALFSPSARVSSTSDGGHKLEKARGEPDQGLSGEGRTGPKPNVEPRTQCDKNSWKGK